jgi:hypothetical protein
MVFDHDAIPVPYQRRSQAGNEQIKQDKLNLPSG